MKGKGRRCDDTFKIYHWHRLDDAPSRTGYCMGGYGWRGIRSGGSRDNEQRGIAATKETAILANYANENGVAKLA
jgi:hypothetical protein